MTSVLYLIGGFILLTGAAEGLVRGAASLARRLGFSPLVIGLTVVSIGTSLPELMVCIEAALQGSSGIALGNVVGSNISNVALILGIAALIRPIHIQAQVVRVDSPLLVVVSLVLTFLVVDAYLGRVDGALLLSGIVAFVFYNLKRASGEPAPVQEEFEEGVPPQHSLLFDLGLLGLGLGGLFLGANLLVEGAVSIARVFGVSKIIIGLTVVAVGTSLPELATSVVASHRGQGDIAVGNALGSSIFNILGILGVTVLIQPLSAQQLEWVDLAVMVGLAVLVVPFFWTKRTLSRFEGAILVGCYLGYLLYLAGI